MYEYDIPVRIEPCITFEQFISKAQNKIDPRRSWVFRGQTKPWPLKTSFERACERFGIPQEQRYELESKMLREFKRRLHLFMNHVPDHTLTDEWLAIMQHYGAPTRLLDFTYSPYVAAYFAFENAENNDNVTIWAIDAKWLDEQLDKNYSELRITRESYQKDRKGKDFDSIFMSQSQYKLVLAASPFRRNERVVYQKGVFLCPGDARSGFMENLLGYKDEQGLKDHVILYTLCIDKEKRNEALTKLELMNINRNTLFPGLDGFAQSFSVNMATLFPYI
jgi:hypothetical protein